MTSAMIMRGGAETSMRATAGPVAVPELPKSQPAPALSVDRVYLQGRSLPFQFRQRRFQHIQPLIEAIIREKGHCRIADIGGTQYYWKIAEDFVARSPVEINLINLEAVPVTNPKFVSHAGNACALDQFADNSFDLVHSNSVIEHVGSWAHMADMARHVRRLAPTYVVQTPNFWFPYEPHFRFPMFHWLPEPVRCRLLMRFNLGFGGRRQTIDAAMRAVQSSNLLDARQMQALFPDARLVRERIGPLTKSVMLIRQG